MDGSDVVLDDGDAALQAGRAKVARLRRLLKRVSVEAARVGEESRESKGKGGGSDTTAAAAAAAAAAAVPATEMD